MSSATDIIRSTRHTFSPQNSRASCSGYAVGCGGHITFSKAAVAALHLLPAFFSFFEEMIPYGPSGHAHWALHYGHVLSPGFDVGLLEGLVSITLIGGHEPGGYLYSITAQLNIVLYVRPVIDSAPKDHGYVPSISVLILSDYVKDLSYLLIIACILVGLYLLRAVAQVPSCLRTLYDYKVCRPVIMSVPVLKYDLRCLGRRYYGGYLHI